MNIRQASRFQRKTWLAKTASETLTTQHVAGGNFITNEGATAAITLTLPDPAGQAGLSAKFCCAARQVLLIDPSGTTGAFYVNGRKLTDGAPLILAIQGEWVEIVSDASSDWHVVGGNYGMWPGYAHDRMVLVENWLRPPGLNADIQNSAESVREIVNTDFELLGTNASSDDATIAAGGGCTIETDASANDQEIILPHLDTSQSAWSTTKWGTEDEVDIRCRITTGSSITATIIWFGLKLTNTPTGATDNDQAFFRYEDTVNSGKFQAWASNNGTDDTDDTGITVATSTNYDLRIHIDAAFQARFFIDDVLVASPDVLRTGIDLIPYIGVQTTTTAAKLITVRPGYRISRKIA